MKGLEPITLEERNNVTIQMIYLALVDLHCNYEVTNENISHLNKFKKGLQGLHQ